MASPNAVDPAAKLRLVFSYNLLRKLNNKAALVVVEILEAGKFALQIANIPKGHEVQVLSPDGPDESFHKWMRNR